MTEPHQTKTLRTKIAELFGLGRHHDVIDELEHLAQEILSPGMTFKHWIEGQHKAHEIAKAAQDAAAKTYSSPPAPPVQLPEIHPDSQGRRRRYVLVCDGGGVRGAFSASILATLEKSTEFKVDFLTDFQVYAGTSTGSIIAASLGCLGIKPADICDLFVQNASTIFPCFNIDFLHEPDLFPDSGKIKVFVEMISKYLKGGDAQILTLQEAAVAKQKRVLISTYEVTENAEGPILLDSAEPIKTAPKSYHLPLWVALNASSAAPLYFPNAQWNNKIFIDGGVSRNDPTPVVISELAKGLRQDEDLYVLSIGTGAAPKNMAHEKELFHLIEDSAGFVTSVDTAVDDTKSLVSTLNFALEGRHTIHYLRINDTNLPASLTAMSKPRNAELLVVHGANIANDFITHNTADLKAFFAK